jgi:serine-type D-Ala-D-Ala carboxypeptidase (penicillin-binding protein 5/6)
MHMSRRPAAAAIVVAAVLTSTASLASAAAWPAPASASASSAPASTAALTALVAAAPTGVRARGAELADATTGTRLWSRGLNTRRPMASITKVMTALVVIRAGHLGQKIRISRAVVAYAKKNFDASIAGLHAGDVLTARQLLEGMLLPSGSDAAFALARAYGPGWRAFVREMNATAARLGMTGTHYANFDGLPWPTEHSTYSTPHDLVILGDAAMRWATFRDIVRQRSYRIGASSQHHRYHWRTTNLLLGSYPGATGIKTGSTAAAGYCLLFEARHDGRTVVGVVLDSSATNPNARFTDAARLLNWAFGINHPLRTRPGPAGARTD